ncbi:NUDIX domain-containing protein [Chitinophagaceae bacterium MMS25-I14]
MKTTGVIIARFQTPYLHEGHTYLLDEIRNRHNKVIVVLGVSPVKGSRKNPLDFYTRERMLKQYAPQLVILPLNDNSSDEVWSRNLDKLLHDTFPQETFILYGSRNCFIPYYHGNNRVAELPELGNHSSTAVRDDNADKVLDTVDFRQGINYAYHNIYPKVYATVDIAVLRNNNTEVLLGRKHQSQLWRFPGGFSDPEDDNFEAAAARELKEECGDIETGSMQYIGSFKIDDWRYRGETDKIITTFFKTAFISGTPQGMDDIAAVAWFPVTQLETMMSEGKMAKEHLPLVQQLVQSL